MKSLFLTIAASALVLVAANADKESKEITVTGDVKCAHCDFKIGDSCSSAIQTTDKTIYLLEGKIAEKFFEENEDVEKATATGTAEKKDDHMVLQVTKVEAAKG